MNYASSEFANSMKKENRNVKWESRLVYERQNCKETMYQRAYTRDCPRFVYRESITGIFSVQIGKNMQLSQ